MSDPRNGKLLNAPDASVVLREVRSDSGHKVGLATLNSEATLNSLSLEMIHLLAPQLDRWAEDDAIVCVFLDGAGERAFAAGGDIQALYRSMVKNHQAGRVVDFYAGDFFEAEYRLDHQLHIYPKPVVVWGTGIVMGGGLGIFSAADVRVVTASSRIAMPEITIGLFPDAGATHLLADLPRHQALFLALTGARMSAGDAMAIGLGTHLIEQAQKAAVLDALMDMEWLGVTERDNARLFERLGEFATSMGESASLLLGHDGTLSAALSGAQELEEIGAALMSLANFDPWVDRCLETFAEGCPTSAGIIVEQLRRATDLTLEESLRLELVIATHCARNTDFAEGIRARIIDKDNRPQWRFSSLEALPWDWVLGHFQPPWPENPLADLSPGARSKT